MLYQSILCLVGGALLWNCYQWLVAVADALPKHLIFGWRSSLVELLPVAGGCS